MSSAGNTHTHPALLGRKQNRLNKIRVPLVTAAPNGFVLQL
jgi:hypothetical protein